MPRLAKTALTALFSSTRSHWAARELGTTVNHYTLEPRGTLHTDASPSAPSLRKCWLLVTILLYISLKNCSFTGWLKAAMKDEWRPTIKPQQSRALRALGTKVLHLLNLDHQHLGGQKLSGYGNVPFYFPQLSICSYAEFECCFRDDSVASAAGKYKSEQHSAAVSSTPRSKHQPRLFYCFCHWEVIQYYILFTDN